jgi:hypothetical protein
MLERADQADAHVAQLLDGLRAASDAMVSDLRNGAEQLGRDLGEIRRGLGGLRSSRPEPGESVPHAPEEVPIPEPAPEPEYHEPEPEPAYQEPEPAYLEPEPAPEPTYVAPQPEEESLKYQGDELQPTEEVPPAPEREPFVPEPETEFAEPEPEPAPAGAGGGSEGARLVALNMALNGTPREETAAYLAENFDLPDQDALLDEVYSRAG